jgi:hypothetical protein
LVCSSQQVPLPCLWCIFFYYKIIKWERCWIERMVQYENLMITPENEWVKISLIMSRSFTLCAVCQLSLFSFLILSHVCFILYMLFFHFIQHSQCILAWFIRIQIYTQFFLKWNKRCTLLSEMEWSEKGRKKEFGSLRLMFLLHLLHRLTYIGFDTNIMSCWRRQQQTTIWWWLETIRI